MSTKAIREALSQLNRLMPDSTWVSPALDEVGAIERAARMFRNEPCPNVLPRDEAEAAWSHLIHIAKEAP